MFTPTASFKDNLQLLPSVDGISHINIMDSAGAIVDIIENKPGKQGSLVVYQYLAEVFGRIDAKAAAHGLEVFAEHTVDAKSRPGAHPNIDRLLDVIDTGKSLDVQVVRA
ncbi:DUF2322 family protein [Sulfitobacter sp. M57]|uniref:DUF2322 family protein n=1 Tax=unclassified Sulfitobacter TaxID=196795 RepID=UPI0023E1CF8A|nr:MULTISPECIES: DUF2322 family protein [unclassified Sulfitobacter]MDF3416705.1 DUF2322 family protein [Sulfitobacter sp. KE5]MDF3424186.1 DUF2322 family protein [Sulfitobacter sp. KE43]MDF3435274.1 DUF2322 family protein [Sulfitobacter sp. KE42]MDF3460888.1 DUF2322 family protein [Sulfitobacter sp. S74]MDF3464788.1 DUF2322 family protein [Sulfitobacter sp. Ks18]